MGICCKRRRVVPPYGFGMFEKTRASRDISCIEIRGRDEDVQREGCRSGTFCHNCKHRRVLRRDGLTDQQQIGSWLCICCIWSCEQFGYGWLANAVYVSKVARHSSQRC